MGFVGLLFLGCTSSGDAPVVADGAESSFKYEFIGFPLEETEVNEFNLRTEQGLTEIEGVFSFNYVCCANLTASYMVDDGFLNIYIDNVGEFCRCPKNYKFNYYYKGAMVKGVRIYGIKYKDVYGYDLMYSKDGE